MRLNLQLGTIRAFMEDLYRQGHARTSVARKLSALRAFSRYLRREGLIDTNPASLAASPKREQKIPAHLSIDEMTRLLEMPDQINRAATKREPHGIATYVREVAADFHAFYRDARVVGAGSDLEPARLTVCAATRDVIATLLDLLGVDAPEEM